MHVGNMQSLDEYDESKVRRHPRHSVRLSHAVIQTLTAWIEAHKSCPYPTKEDKRTLQETTGLRAKQINDWFINIRRRRRDLAPDTLRNGLPIQSRHALEELDNANPDQLVPYSEPCLVADTGARNDETSAARIYQCTFCTDRFRTRHDWVRHETSLHLSLKRYICCPSGPTVFDECTDREVCAYCGITEPTAKHIGLHNHESCQARPPSTRIFTRKDHLRQHLKLVHDCHVLPDSWHLEAKFVNSRCGFCGQRFTTWDARNDHLVVHFKGGARMESWTGCRGLDTDVSAHVVAAMPPFLIGVERSNSLPFSASKRRHGPAATTRDGRTKTVGFAWESLAVELHTLVQTTKAMHNMISDRTLQAHARMLVHGTSHSTAWTPADNQEWLDLFKRAHCLGVIPGTIDGSTAYIPEDLEIYHDLGLPIPSRNEIATTRLSALITMFGSDSPLPKTYLRFSSLPVTFEQARCFETIAKPWPDAGMLGETIVITDLLFSSTLGLELNIGRAGVPILQDRDDHRVPSSPVRNHWKRSGHAYSSSAVCTHSMKQNSLEFSHQA